MIRLGPPNNPASSPHFTTLNLIKVAKSLVPCQVNIFICEHLQGTIFCPTIRHFTILKFWNAFIADIDTRNWTSLVVQWIRLCLPMQRTRVWSLVREDSTCLRITKAVRLCSTTTESALLRLQATTTDTKNCGVHLVLLYVDLTVYYKVSKTV